MTDTHVDESADRVAKPRTWGRAALIVAGALVVALGVSAAVVIPRAQQAQRVEEYTALVDELRLINDNRAEVETTVHAATALSHVRHAEVLSAANAVAELGEAKEPMLPAAHAAALGMVGVSAADELGPLETDEDDASPQVMLTSAYVEAKEVEEQARAAAEEAGDEVPEGELPALFAELTVDQAVELIDAPLAAEPVTPVSDEHVTDDVIEEMRAEISSAEAELERAQVALMEQLERHQAVAETAQILLPVLQEAAAAVDDFLAAVEEEAAKAEDDVAEKTAAAADRVRESADSTNASEIQARIASYVAAGEESLVSHAAVVKAEEEAAEAKRKAEEEAARQRGSSSAGSGVCTRYVSTWYGGSRLILVPCR